jgi:hypothetical protein
MAQAAVYTLAPRPQGTVSAESEGVAAARGNFHAAFRRQNGNFPRGEAGVTVAYTELPVQVVAPGPNAVTGTYDQGVLASARHADDRLSEISNGTCN